MKSRTAILILAILLSGSSVFAQSNKAMAHLTGPDNYLIPVVKKGAFIGKIISPEGSMKIKYSLVKDTSGLFQIDKRGNISLKKRVKLSASDPAFRYAITFKAGNLEKEIELVKDQFIHNKVVAHRGAWKNHESSQNSLSSLKNAIAIGCEASEFDIWLSSDGIPVICHDASVGGKIIEQTTFEELSRIALKNNDFVPSLEQYLLSVKSQNKTRIVPEIKTSLISQERTLELTEKVINMVHKLKVQGWVSCYISFNYPCMLKVKELDKVAKVAYLEGDKTLKGIKDDNMWGIDFNGKMFKENVNLIKEAHDLGLTVNAWTINDLEDMKSLLNGGIDLITTNEPEILLEYLKSNK